MVEHPADAPLLWHATRSSLRLGARWGRRLKLPGWRQEKHWQDKLQSAFVKVRNQRRRQRKDVEAYLALCSSLLGRLETWFGVYSAKLPAPVLRCLEDRLAMGVTLLDHVRERLLEGQLVASPEKIYSVFEPTARWISKGKAGCPQELGVPVAILEDQYQYILGHRVLWEESDMEAAVPLVRECRERWPELRAASFDRGFHSPGNRQALDEILDPTALPAKGRLDKQALERESAEDFAAARKQRPAVESAIHQLECHGLDRAPTHGAAGFATAVALSILAANVHRLGKALLAEDHRREKRKRRTRLKAA